MSLEFYIGTVAAFLGAYTTYVLLFLLGYRILLGYRERFEPVYPEVVITLSLIPFINMAVTVFVVFCIVVLVYEVALELGHRHRK